MRYEKKWRVFVKAPPNSFKNCTIIHLLLLISSYGICIINVLKNAIRIPNHDENMIDKVSTKLLPRKQNVLPQKLKHIHQISLIDNIIIFVSCKKDSS